MQYTYCTFASTKWGWPDIPLGVVIKMKADKVCKVVRQQGTWSWTSTHTSFVFRPSWCRTEHFSLIQSRAMPSLACVLWWGCQSMTDSSSGRSQQGGNWPCFSQDICSGSARSQGVPNVGSGFTLWQSKHSLWAGKKHFTLQMGLGRVIRFLQGGLGISRWLEVSTLFILMPQIDSPQCTQSYQRRDHTVTGGELSLCWTIQI